MGQLQLDGSLVLVFIAAQLFILVVTIRRSVYWRITAMKAMANADEDVSVANRRFSHAFEASQISTFVMDVDMVIVAVNKAFIEFAEMPESDLLDKKIHDIIGQEQGQAAAERLQAALVANSQFGQSINELRRDDGAVMVYRETYTVMPSGRRIGKHITIQIEDITEQHLAKAELQRKAHHDSLTGLPNRSLLLQRLGATLSGLQIGEHFGIAFLDLDDFKAINDQLGHAAGDELLIGVAEHLLEAVRRIDTVARFGGDEFVVLFHDVESEVEAFELADRVRVAVSQPVLLEGREVEVTMSLGLTIGAKGDSPEDLLRNADSALYRGKEAGKNRSVLYDPALEPERVVHPTFDGQLRQAFQNGDLRVEFEPVFALTGMAQVGLTTSLRWDHPELGTMALPRILALAEQAGMVVPLEMWFQRAAMDAFQQRVTGERQNWWLSYQVSIETLCEDDFIVALAAVVENWEMSPSRLLLEISDEVFTHRERAYNELIGPIRELGCRIMIRESGRGVCIARSATARYDALTLDRDMLRSAGSEYRGDAMLQAFTYSGTALGVPTILQHLDTPELVELAKDAGATFLCGKALTENPSVDTRTATRSEFHQGPDRLMS